MACGSCGQRRQQMSQQQAAAMASGQGPKYTVQTPDGGSKTFDDYLAAAVYRRQTNGTITTHS